MEIQFFEVNGTKYIASFPWHWIDTMLDETGPDMCENCKLYGSIGDVFVLFCANCAMDEYERQRGPGSLGPCSEELANYVDTLYKNLEDDLTDSEEIEDDEDEDEDEDEVRN